MPAAKKKDDAADAPTRPGIANSIAAPLGFFALALIVVEAFLGSAILFGNLEPAHRLYAVMLGVGLFVFIVSIVGLLAWFRPMNLIYDRTAHLIDRGKYHWGSKSTPVPPEDLLPPPEEKEART